MKRIILLRFHKDLTLVQNRINLLRYFNPNMPIYGLFGGKEENFSEFRDNLRDLAHIYYLPITEHNTKWRFSDNSILQWFKDFGKSLDFDIVHTVEYDLVLLDKLENIYPYGEGERHVYITCLVELDKIIGESNWFVNPKFPNAECYEFVRLMHEEYGITTLYNSKAPGATLTKEYLEGYTKLNLPLIGFDEIRIPAIAQILNIPMKDTGFVKDWFDEDPASRDFRLFNTDNFHVVKSEVLEAYRTGYKKAFHHCYDLIALEELLPLNS